VAWLSERYGAGQYELRLQRGQRVLCICKAECSRARAAAEVPPTSTRRVNGADRVNGSADPAARADHPPES